MPERCKEGLIGHCHSRLENSAERSMDCQSPHQILQGNGISNWSKPFLLDFLANTPASFCPCPRNFPEAALKSHGLISLMEVISRQHTLEYCGVVVINDRNRGY